MEKKWMVQHGFEFRLQIFPPDCAWTFWIWSLLWFQVYFAHRNGSSRIWIRWTADLSYNLNFGEISMFEVISKKFYSLSISYQFISRLFKWFIMQLRWWTTSFHHQNRGSWEITLLRLLLCLSLSWRLWCFGQWRQSIGSWCFRKHWTHFSHNGKLFSNLIWTFLICLLFRLNLVLHTNVSTLIFPELFISRHLQPSRKSAIKGLTLFMLGYLIWVYLIKINTGRWVYGIIGVLTAPQRIVFFVICGLVALGLYFIGEFLIKFVSGTQKSVKTKRK